MSTVARIEPSFVRRQRRFIGWIESVPLESYELSATWDRLGDLARPVQADGYGAQAAVVPVVEERYSIRGFDERPAVEDLFLTFVKIGGEWRIADDADLDGVGLFSARHLWDFGPIERSRSAHFMLLRHPCESRLGCVPVGSDFLRLAEEALARVRRYWHIPWKKRVVILAPSNSEELARMIQATFELDNFVAFAYSTVDTSRGLDYTGHRIMLNWEQIQGRSRDDVLGIMAHELLHVASRAVSGPFIPIYVEEGVADYVGRDADPASLSFFNSEVAAGAFDRRLPEDFEFTTGDPDDIFRSYQEGHSAHRFFVNRWSPRRFESFYRRIGAVEVAPGTVGYHVSKALKRSTGLDFTSFERAWASSIE